MSLICASQKPLHTFQGSSVMSPFVFFSSHERSTFILIIAHIAAPLLAWFPLSEPSLVCHCSS